MTCFRNNLEPEDKAAQYATSEDFRRVFADDVDSLYQLAFLLTGDHDRAELCVVAGVEDSVRGNSVFKERAHSWAKRTVIQQAVRTLNLKPPCHADSSEDGTTSGGLRSVPNRQDAIDRLLSQDDFDRFVFLMSVLERYPEHDFVLLLGCSPPDVRDARMRALQQMTWGRPPRTEEDLVVDEVTSGVGGSHNA